MKTSPKRPYSVIENEGFGLVFAKTLSIISGTVPSLTILITDSIADFSGYPEMLVSHPHPSRSDQTWTGNEGLSAFGGGHNKLVFLSQIYDLLEASEVNLTSLFFYTHEHGEENLEQVHKHLSETPGHHL